MTWLIGKIYERPDAGHQESIAVLSRGGVVNGPVTVLGLQRLFRNSGYEVSALARLGRYPIADWPLFAVVYVSGNKEGKGRGASSVHRLPVRRVN